MTKRKNKTHNTPAKILVVGIGGGGINAVNHMIACGMQGVEFVAVDTDKQQLLLSKVQNCIQIGENLTEGLDAGNYSEFGQKAAEESRDLLIEQMQGSDMVFITTGMGGNTGTGAAFIVAEYARKAGAVTVGVAAIPFSFEGKRRMNQAVAGIMNLMEHVDALITVSYDRLLQIIDRRTSVQEAFHIADEVMRRGIQGITDLLLPNLISADFVDVKSILAHAGVAGLGIGTARGKNGAQAAAEAAVKSPLLEASIEGDLGVLFNITGGEDLTLDDVRDVANIITEAVDPDANIIFGAIIDKKLAKDEVQVTIIPVKHTNISKSKDVPIYAPKRAVCANCKEHYYKGDKYCRFCGAPMGEPYHVDAIIAPIYGPPPVKRVHTCTKCGYTWKTKKMIDKECYCPKCGGDAPVSSIDDTWWKK